MIAFLFPGQGSQSVGMGADLIGAYTVCRRVFEEADETLGIPLTRLCTEGPEADLQLTATAQPAILTASVAALRALESQGIRPDIVAGHSLGEYSALVAAGAVAFKDALVLVRKRGTYMQEAVPVGQGAMAAIMGLDAEILERICAEASVEGQLVSVANLNAPEQTVISGHAGAVDAAISLAQQRGARRAIKLAVSAPFHCALMQPAADRLAEDLATTTFHDLSAPLVANVSALPNRSGSEAREALVKQITSPVRWDQSVRTLAAAGARLALEVGPGKVLSGLVRRIEPRISCIAVGDSAGVASAKEAIS